jgi:hypothetical protein
MRHYQIRPREDTPAPFTVRAVTYEQAAQMGARRLHGRQRGLFARRVTGDPGKSGYFQAYIPVTTGGASSYGRNFHVREIDRSMQRHGL